MNIKSLYIASMEPKAGKLLITLGIMELLTQNVGKIAFFRPVIRTKKILDNDIELIRHQFCPSMEYEDCYAFDSDQVKQFVAKGQIKEFYKQLLIHINKLYENYDFVLCEGLNSSEFVSLFAHDINLDIAKNLNIPFIGVINGQKKSLELLQQKLHIAQNIIKKSATPHFSTMINRLDHSIHQMLNTTDLLASEKTTYLLPENQELNQATLADVKKSLNAQCLLGSSHDMQRIVKQIKIATMTIEHFLNYIEDGDLIIVGGDRADILLATIATLSSNNYPNISGILLTGGYTPQDNVLKLLQGISLSIPILSVSLDTYDTTQAINNIVIEISYDDSRKNALALGLFEQYVSAEKLMQQLKVSQTNIVTPIMFEHRLFNRAKSQRMNIVLPEATDERILRAVEILLRRQIVDITLLGIASEILNHSASLGLDISQAQIINPVDSPNLNDYSKTFYQLRKHKGATLDSAKDTMLNATYFATMMVHKNHADGMVSGAIHTTGDTIRPALQFIKTSKNISVVSSVFFMCFDTQVLVYGDCAINPDPDAQQLAEIAISSAATAQTFHIDAKVAMLSYSSGSSGKGKDVDKVRLATKIVQQKQTHLPITGPIQYDAAISPEVAQTKLPGNTIAGHATVFIFPDLNTGNNTYKAVQRSSGAVAIGPILQGLKKPVNDLSRGCLVADIVNTVAITAIQAQNLAPSHHPFDNIES